MHSYIVTEISVRQGFGMAAASGSGGTVMRTLLVSTCLLVVCLIAFGQSDRGTITGTISDPAGAVVANAVVEAKNAETGAAYQAGSSNTGNYTLAQLPAGTYELNVSVPGFKKYVRPGIIVNVAAAVRVDATLEVGSATESVTIQAEAPLLKTESGELSHIIDYNRADNLPILTLTGTGTGLGNIRNPLQVVTLLPGASFQGENTLRINGMPSSSQAIRIEGQDATNGFWRQNNQNVQAGVDAIQEVAIQTSNFAAEYGQAGGGYFNYTMRSGTNQFHGSAYDYFNNEALNAGTPFTDAGLTNSQKTGQHIRNVVRRNDYGFTLGGPVWIPKVYNGKDKTFFFFTFEQFREGAVVRTGTATMPTSAYRNGDFSGAQLGALTAAGQPLVDSLGQQLSQNQIFDPKTTRTAPDGTLVRSPYPNNRIPLTDMDPVALKIQSMFPAPLGPQANQPFNNYAIPAYTNFRHTTIPSVKIDQAISSTIKLSGYWQQTHTLAPNNNGFTPGQFPWSAPEPTDTVNNTARINYDQTLRPTMLFHLGIGLFYTAQPAVPPSYDQTQLGATFAPFYINQFPNFGLLNDTAGQKGGVNFPVGASVGNTFAVQNLKDVKPTANVSLTWVKGNHTYKFGGEAIIEGFPQVNYTRANGQYNFGQNQTGDPWEFNRGAFASTGFNYASFLIGAPNSLTISQVTDSRIGNHQLGFYAQDTWKVTRRFTLDYGLRYDYVTLLREEHGRMQSADFHAPNPLAGGRPGNVIYEATCHCSFNRNYPYALGPRLGAAYQITEKTVLRVGAGLAYGSSPVNAYLSYSVPDFYTFTAPSGSYQSIAPVQSGNPFAPGNPFGNAPIVWPDFSPHYPIAFRGTTPPQSPFISIDRNAGRPPRIFQWSIGLQHEVARNLVVEAAYVGNRGAWWTAPALATINYNALTPEGLKRDFGLDITNTTDRNLLGLQISNPAVIARFPYLANPNNVYPGFPANSTLNQALRPYPQWNGVPPFLGPPLGDTWYDSLQAKLTKRYSHGLDTQVAFTWQKELTLGANSDTNYLTPNAGLINDVFNYQQNKQISGFSRPFLLVISANYTTPRLNGQGAALKALSWIARDWTLGTVLRYQSGAVLRSAASNNALLAQLDRGATNNPAVWGGGTTFQNRVEGQPLFLVDPNCHCFDPNTTLALNPKAWVDAAPGQFGTAAPYYSNYRWQRQPAESLAFGRTFRFKERASVNIRAEFQNIFNRLFLSAPCGLATAGAAAASTCNPQAATTRNQLTGNLTGGYGYMNMVPGTVGFAPQPRSGQLVARFVF
ncbi:MAG: hypothetical protein C5B51_28390 [Terriglobia bacterium]|nr:MAG: hypothetical protein C5B51_28390 [Terriglobia bacterium]